MNKMSALRRGIWQDSWETVIGNRRNKPHWWWASVLASDLNSPLLYSVAVASNIFKYRIFPFEASITTFGFKHQRSVSGLGAEHLASEEDGEKTLAMPARQFKRDKQENASRQAATYTTKRRFRDLKSVIIQAVTCCQTNTMLREETLVDYCPEEHKFPLCQQV